MQLSIASRLACCDVLQFDSFGTSKFRWRFIDGLNRAN